MLACYGQSEYHSLTETQQKLWTSQVGRSLASPLKLAILSPTNEVFGENVVSPPTIAIWMHALEPDIPLLQPTSYGWE